MSVSTTDSLLVINCGSSSVKSALFDGQSEQRLLGCAIERIGLPEGRLLVIGAEGEAIHEESLSLADHASAIAKLFAWLDESGHKEPVRAVGHRLVHGGPRYRTAQRVDDEVLGQLRELIPFDPIHLPSEVAGIEAVANALPGIAQVACFDTSFHRHLPAVARTFPLPRKLLDRGIHRYGFHGLSYEYILETLLERDEPSAQGGRIIVAHLGNGASMAAILDGTCVDTTMGFTSAGGLVMGSRSGDLDPGLLIFLLEHDGMSTDDLKRMLVRDGGMKGVSGISSDVRELLAAEEIHPEAAEALELFCYQARKFLGALAAAMGGLDMLVFTAGIGEHSPVIRNRICAGLDWMGLTLDGERNRENSYQISSDYSRVKVLVMPTNEELMIARQTRRLVG
ncbi:Acetate kinase [Planctomycetes bacterium Pan216]|uniref:Acetate kinase n=1 Tax=Kolteria novifilia TaxID=2527975 RepID=A0A518BBZ6_9BACT|nr:Acetate kinase [Planctomycetes bacterium Pan216]